MPNVAEEKDTAKVKRRDLAELLGVEPAVISKAAHKKYFCKGYRVFDWAVWHPRGNMVRHYEVPKPILRDLVPPSEHMMYGL